MFGFVGTTAMSKFLLRGESSSDDGSSILGRREDRGGCWWLGGLAALHRCAGALRAGSFWQRVHAPHPRCTLGTWCFALATAAQGSFRPGKAVRCTRLLHPHLHRPHRPDSRPSSSPGTIFRERVARRAARGLKSARERRGEQLLVGGRYERSALPPTGAGRRAASEAPPSSSPRARDEAGQPAFGGSPSTASSESAPRAGEGPVLPRMRRSSGCSLDRRPTRRIDLGRCTVYRFAHTMTAMTNRSPPVSEAGPGRQQTDPTAIRRSGESCLDAARTGSPGSPGSRRSREPVAAETSPKQALMAAVRGSSVRLQVATQESDIHAVSPLTFQS
jgi:hypothetical protein